MSRLKSRKSLESVSRVNEAKTQPSDLSTGAVLNEGSFKSLQNRIQAKLSSTGTVTGTKRQTGNQSNPIRGTKDATRGKKRNSNGDLVNGKEYNPQVSVDSNTLKGHNEVFGDDPELQKVLKELGGTQEDLAMIADADSDSEMEGVDGEPQKGDVVKKNGSLEKGMANILKEIALAQGARQEVVSDESDEASSDEEEGETAPVPVQLSKQDVRKGKFSHKCEPRADWFNIPSPNVNMEKGPEYTPTQYSIDQLHSHAKTLLENENEAFRLSQQSSSSQAFYNTVIASGTLSDKISAFTLAVQESPVHNVKALETLISLATKRNRAQAVDVLRALKDLLAQGSLLPSDRRLYTFSTQPAVFPAVGQVRSWKKGDKLPPGLSESDIICWAYEHWLKEQYFEVLKFLEIWCNDEIEFSKQRAIGYVYELLREKPEQESNLLRLLINKLGDPVKKIASQTSYLLMQLLVTHPAMKMIVISAIESDFLFRPGQSMHGKYYAAVTLNQTALSIREEEVAKKLLGIYFSLFTGLLKLTSDKFTKEDASAEQDAELQEGVISLNRRQQKQKKGKKAEPENAQGEELREKLISAVLTGVNRAYPYAGADHNNFNKHLDTLFAVTHSANFNTGIQAMMLIQQLTSTNQASADRFYRTLYESLLDPRLIVASKQQLYLNLLHRSLKSDVSIKRVKAFVKRLLQILSLHDPAFICGVFFLLKDLEKTFPSLTALLDQPVDQDDDQEVFYDVDEDARNNSQGTVRPESAVSNYYDGHKRAPEHANADNSCAWELLPFLAHFHPSVSVSADSYVQQLKLPGKADLSLHTLIHFLDRFVYRNPKLSSNKMRGASIMQPMIGDDAHAVLISSVSGKSGPAVNTDEFRNKKDDEIAADDVFFHKYFANLGKDTRLQKVKKNRKPDEDGSIGDDGEDAVWKAMMDSAPDLEGDESNDEDVDMSDFEAEMDDGDENLDSIVDADESDSGIDIEAGIFDESAEEVSEAEQAGLEDEHDGSDFEGLSSEDEATTKKKERRKSEKEKRKKMKSMPTFASAADYAQMLENDDDEDLG